MGCSPPVAVHPTATVCRIQGAFPCNRLRWCLPASVAGCRTCHGRNTAPWVNRRIQTRSAALYRHSLCSRCCRECGCAATPVLSAGKVPHCGIAGPVLTEMAIKPWTGRDREAKLAQCGVPVAVERHAGSCGGARSVCSAAGDRNQPTKGSTDKRRSTVTGPALDPGTATSRTAEHPVGPAETGNHGILEYRVRRAGSID